MACSGQTEIKTTKATKTGSTASHKTPARRVPPQPKLKADPARAIAVIKKHRGHITYDEKNIDKPVIGVGLAGPTVTDAEIAHLEGLTELQTLEITKTKVSDAGLIYLKGLTKLQRLDLSFTPINGAGLIHLKGLTEVRELKLHATNVYDAGLVHL